MIKLGGGDSLVSMSEVLDKARLYYGQGPQSDDLFAAFLADVFDESVDYMFGYLKRNQKSELVPHELCELYPKDWAKVVLMISPQGEIHAIGGDPNQGDGDVGYVGISRLREFWAKRRDKVGQ